MSLQLLHRRTLVASPSRTLRYLPLVAAAVDTAMIVLVAAICLVLRRSWDVFPASADVRQSLPVAGPVILLVWIAVVAMAGGYTRSVFELGTDEFRRVARATLLATGLVGVGCYLFKFPLSRGFFLLSALIGVPALVLGRLLLRLLIQRARALGGLQHQVLVAGSGAAIDEVAAALGREKKLGYQILGALLPDHEMPRDETGRGIPVLGSTDDIATHVMASGADLVFLASGSLVSAEQMRTLAWELEHHDVQMVVAPSVTDVSGDRVRVRPVGGLPLIHIDRPRGALALQWSKRTFDVVASLLIIAFVSPLMAVAAMMVRRNDGGPVMFRQTRTGRDGREFSCLKFRTMVVDAEAALARLHAEMGFDGGLFKMREDPRITAPGRLLRKLSIDELPQLFNVLRGDMSLVGPRPPLPAEVAQYEGHAHRRLRVRPGLTGLWQVSGRSDLSYEEAIRLDLYYVDNWSMFQDLSILVKTIGVVLRHEGAY